MTAGEEVLAVSDLDVRYRSGFQAVSGVSLSLARNERLAVIGPNGAGKTSLVSAICGDLRRKASVTGDLRIEGRSVARRRPHVRARMGLGRTYQVAQVFPGMTVLEHLALARIARRRGVGRWLREVKSEFELTDAEAKVIDLLGLRKVLTQRVSQLGQGDLKLVELAATLCAEPQILLLDEPTAGMGSREAENVCEVIETIVALRPSLSIILIEHNMDVVFRVAQRAIVMHQGRVIADGTPDDVRADSEVRALYLGYHAGA
ncbi:ATP-binding cassette domain-containing protein [Nocardioides agariphilus]|uniref:ATP-binding cassette domain-containing protein n=1 Tax=Nocardioides agariphilus TaxID=433664 RepID=A0A930YJX5_9ACTN|nr:ATP-binding cassette domain-containing protein [Nocardioides agariphilus]